LLEQFPFPSTTVWVSRLERLRVAPLFRMNFATLASFAALDPLQVAAATNSNLVTVLAWTRTNSRRARRLEANSTEDAPLEQAA
jgi:hypothetical protein